MTRKLIISEAQIEMLSHYINENNQERIVKRIVADLDLNYEPTVGTYKKGGEFFEQGMVSNKVNSEMMTPKSLLKYLTYKYDVGGAFIKQVITDWFKGNLSDSSKLSKNISIK